MRVKANFFLFAFEQRKIQTIKGKAIANDGGKLTSKFYEH